MVHCKNLYELEEVCQKAKELHTDLENTNMVFGEGNPDADLIIVGEAPGANEDAKGVPFIGAAGKQLNKMLKAVKLDRNDVYITNILKHRPPENRDPTKEERIRSLPYLAEQIRLINPKIVLCLGKVSGQTLTTLEKPLRDLRRMEWPWSINGTYFKVIVTYHPAALLYHPSWKKYVWEDLIKVKKYLVQQ